MQFQVPTVEDLSLYPGSQISSQVWCSQPHTHSGPHHRSHLETHVVCASPTKENILHQSVCKHLASFPGPNPASHLTASNRKLGEGLGMRPVNTPICRRVCKCVPQLRAEMCIFFTSELCTFFLPQHACVFAYLQAHKFYQIMSTYINTCHMHALVHAHTCSHTHTMLLFSFCHWGFHPMLITILYTGPWSTLAHP